MKLKRLFTLLLATLPLFALAQQGGVSGKVVSRNGSEALSNVEITIEKLGVTVKSDSNGDFRFADLPNGDYTLSFSTPEFEDLELLVKVGDDERKLKAVFLSPLVMGRMVDDAFFAEFDSDSSSSDAQSLPTALGSSKDLFNNIAGYRFSEMRFNVRGYDSPYSDIMLNGIRFNDALTGYGPWSLWSGLNDATRNQESYTGAEMSEHGIGSIGGMTNINARASQMRKGFRFSLSNANMMYRLRAMVSYASGLLDNGWSYAFSASTRQGGNGYVDGVYYNSYAYFASAEKLFDGGHSVGLTVLASPSERGALQASTQEAYDLFGNNYYNPNVGLQAGDLRNSRVRRTHEPIVMLNYIWDINEQTRLNAATSIRFGKNGYSALTWSAGSDPRADYYRYMPSNAFNFIIPGTTSDQTIHFDILEYAQKASVWTGRMDFDAMYHKNQYIETDDPYLVENYSTEHRSSYMLEERHTDQIDYNFAANINHIINDKMRIIGGANLRVNRTSYFTEVLDLLGGDYWYDVDKFAERDMPDVISRQNNLDYYLANGHAPVVREGDKYGYYYRAHVMESNAWAQYQYTKGNFNIGVGAEGGYTTMHREGMWRKGLFPENSLGDSEKLDYITYTGKVSAGYRIAAEHSFELNAIYSEQAPKFSSSFVSPRTRNSTTPGLTTEKIMGGDLTYNLSLPYVKARVSGYYSTINDQAKVISFYDDTSSSFTNFAMSGIDERYYGVELGISVPIYQGLSLVGALNWGDYTYTSNPDFVQTIDNVDKVVLVDKVNWEGMHVESTPQIAANIGLDYRAPRNWFIAANLNYYDKRYLSMNPMYRTSEAVSYYTDVLTNPASSTEQQVEAVLGIKDMRAQEEFGADFTLGASVGKNWYINYNYMVGFSFEVKNILNNQDIKTGGYEQMRLNKIRTEGGETKYTRFDSKYFYMLGTTYYLNLYVRF